MLQRFGMEDSKPVCTPMVPPRKSFNTSDTSDDLDADIPYHSAIGSLMYLIVGTRPDIAFVVGKLAQHS